MEEKSNDFDKRSTIEKLSLEEAEFKYLDYVKETLKAVEKQIYKKVEEHVEQQVKPHTDITYKDKEKLKELLYETYRRQLLDTCKEGIKVYEESLEMTRDKERRVTRKLEEVKRGAKGITAFDLERSSKRILTDTHGEKEKDKEA